MTGPTDHADAREASKRPKGTSRSCRHQLRETRPFNGYMDMRVRRAAGLYRLVVVSDLAAEAVLEVRDPVYLAPGRQQVAHPGVFSWLTTPSSYTQYVPSWLCSTRW